LNRAGRGDVDRWQTWPADVEGYLAQLPDGPPRVLLGISWGGKLAGAVARRRPELVDALGFICPGLFAKKRANAVQRAALKLVAAVGLRHVRVTVPLQDPALFTGHARWQAYVGADPLALRKVTVRFALADLDLTRFATEAPEQIEPKAALLVLAGRDRIIDNARVRRYFKRLGAAERRLVEYAEATHTLEFEPDPAEFLRELRDWVGGAVGG
jgi:alpha-beta hydrolase superfamily lysophospholipase